MNSTACLYNLKSFARQNGIPLITALKICLQNEFLYRLSKTSQRDTLLLRGKYLVDLLTDSFSDTALDFLYTGKNHSKENIEQIANKIISKAKQSDNIELQISGCENLDESRAYKGYSITVIGRLCGMRTSFLINIGIDDELAHAPEEISTRDILGDGNAGIFLSYPAESIVSEKLDIVMRRFGIDDNMSHLYDIYLLSMNFNFDGIELQRAVKATFLYRKNDCNRDAFKRLLTLEQKTDMRRRWQQYANSNSIDITLISVMERVREFLSPVYENILHGSRLERQWNALMGRWEEPVYIY